MKYAALIQALGTLFIGVALLVGVGVVANATQNGDQARSITVTGKATAKVATDESTITGSWQQTADTAAKAREEVERLASDGIVAVKKLGIEENKIKTIRADVYPQYDYSRDESPKITGYVAQSTVEVTLNNVDQAQQVINTLTEQKATSTTGPQFGVSGEARDALQKELKVAAIADAKAQAEVMAKQAGGRLGKVLSVGGGNFASSSREVPMLAAADLAATGEKAEPADDIQPGEDELVVTVSVSYQLK